MARVLSTSAPFASAWLAPDNADGVLPPFLSDAQFALLTCMRAGLPVYADQRSTAAARNANLLDQCGTQRSTASTGARYRVHTHPSQHGP